MNEMSLTGIFGGTFDPIHKGHLKLAKTAYEELSLKKVVFMPAYIPPHKTEDKITAEVHRMEMTRLATESCPYFEVSDFEIRLQGASYTARTLEKLADKYDGLVFIVGADSFMAIDKWYHPETIFANAQVACAYRDGISRDTLETKAREYKDQYNGVCHILHMPDTDISSTDIRNGIHKEEVKELLPQAVYSYIQENGLYV